MPVLGACARSRLSHHARTHAAQNPSQTPSGWPKARWLVTTFVGSAAVGVVFTWLNVESLNYGPERAYARVDRAIDATLASTEQEHARAVGLGLRGERLEPLDWVVVGTHLQRALETDYAANAYDRAYVTSGGSVQAGRDWMHQVLLEAPFQP